MRSRFLRAPGFSNDPSSPAFSGASGTGVRIQLPPEVVVFGPARRADRRRNAARGRGNDATPAETSAYLTSIHDSARKRGELEPAIRSEGVWETGDLSPASKSL